MEGLTPVQLHTAPEPGSWSVNDVLAHLRACHDVFGGNILRIVAEDTPTFKGVTPRALIRRTNYPEWEFRTSFEAFARQRAELLAVLEPLPPDGWARIARVTGMLGETYERSVLYYAARMARHEWPHLRQIGRIVTAVRREICGS
jgi:DinB superfamily